MPKTKQNTKPWRERGKKIATRLADTSLPEVTFVTTLVLGRWWQNSDFSYPIEVFWPIILFGVLASALYYGYRLLLGPGLASHIAALLLSYIFYIYSLIHGRVDWLVAPLPDTWLTPFNRSAVLAVLLALICGLIGWLFGKAVSRFKVLHQLQPYKILLFVIAFTFGVQIVRSGVRLIEISGQLSYRHPSAAINASSVPSHGKPDVYYFVLDRYASEETLKRIYGFDNSQMMDFLDEQGFVTRPEAYSNYPFTMMSLASTFSMEYLTDFKKFSEQGKWQTGFPYRQVLRNPPVAQILKQQGYQYNQLSSWWDFTRLRVKADSQPTNSFRLRIFGMSFYMSDLQRDIINKSILSPWMIKGIGTDKVPVVKYDLDRNPSQNFEAQIASLKSIAKRDNKSKPQFSFVHFLSPHEPYVFLPDGTSPEYDGERNDFGVDEYVKYINQIQYVNKRVKEVISTIREQSPEAIIIIQPDEGPYPKQFRFALTEDSYYDPINLPASEARQKYGITASYLFPALPKEEVKKLDSSVNAFRFLLNNYFGYQLPLLPDCHFSVGDKYQIYNYQLISKHLTSLANKAECQKY